MPQLPPGQRRIEGFPRFSRPAPAVQVGVDPVIKIRGALTEPVDLPLTRFATLPRRELTADFHCVAGWTATDLHWEGVAFETVHRTIIEPALAPGAVVTHLVWCALDGYRSVVSIDDAVADDVLLADRLDGRPLGSEHGAPLRVVSPQQYGYVSTKHLCGIEVHTAEPKGTPGVVMRLLSPHPRARVWHEERHRHVPSWALRRVYRATISPIAAFSARSGRRGDAS